MTETFLSPTFFSVSDPSLEPFVRTEHILIKLGSSSIALLLFEHHYSRFGQGENIVRSFVTRFEAASYFSSRAVGLAGLVSGCKVRMADQLFNCKLSVLKIFGD